MTTPSQSAPCLRSPRRVRFFDASRLTRNWSAALAPKLSKITVPTLIAAAGEDGRAPVASP